MTRQRNKIFLPRLAQRCRTKIVPWFVLRTHFIQQTQRTLPPGKSTTTSVRRHLVLRSGIRGRRSAASDRSFSIFFFCFSICIHTFMILMSIMLIGAASALNRKYGDKLFASCTCPANHNGVHGNDNDEEEPLEEPYQER